MCRSPPLLRNMKQTFLVKQPGSTALTRQRSSEQDLPFDDTPEVKCTPAKRRAVKILYPAQVRKYLPPEKKDWAKRTLLLLLCVVTAQVYTAVEAQEGTVDAIAVAMGGPGHSPLSDASGERALVLPSLSVDVFPPTNGSAPLLPLMMPEGVGPAVTAVCHGMGSSSVACRM